MFYIEGVWSVSPLDSCSVEKNELQGTWESNKELTQSQNATDSIQPPYGSGCSTQGRNICVFTDRLMAPLASCDALDHQSVELCYSSALDREARIKELLSKQEKLLADMRQKKTAN